MDDLARSEKRGVVEAATTQGHEILDRVAAADRAAAFGAKQPSPHAALAVVVVFVGGDRAADDQRRLGRLNQGGESGAAQLLAIAALAENLETEGCVQLVADGAAVASARNRGVGRRWHAAQHKEALRRVHRN